MSAAATAGASVGRDLEFLGAVPAGLIEDEDRVCAGGDFGGDLIEMELHRFGITERQNVNH